MEAIKKVKLAKEAGVIGEAIILAPNCGIQVFDVAAYHDDGDIDIFIGDGGAGLMTIGSGYWVDTKAADGFVEAIKDVFKQRGIKVTKNEL